jgi:hypothetical protein
MFESLVPFRGLSVKGGDSISRIDDRAPTGKTSPHLESNTSRALRASRLRMVVSRALACPDAVPTVSSGSQRWKRPPPPRQRLSDSRSRRPALPHRSPRHRCKFASPKRSPPAQPRLRACTRPMSCSCMYYELANVGWSTQLRMDLIAAWLVGTYDPASAARFCGLVA